MVVAPCQFVLPPFSHRVFPVAASRATTAELGWPPTITMSLSSSSKGVLPTPKKGSGIVHSLDVSCCQINSPVARSRHERRPSAPKLKQRFVVRIGVQRGPLL